MHQHSSFVTLTDAVSGFIAQTAGPGITGADAEGRFEELALALFRAQFEHVPPYRRLCEARGVRPEQLRDWRDIPAVFTGAFKEFTFSSLAPAERVAVFHSSGTTGQRPSRHFHDAGSLALYEASAWPWFARHVLAGLADAGRPARWLMLTPSPAEAPHSSLVHMLGAMAKRAGTGPRWLARADPDGAWRLEATTALAALDAAAAAEQPVVLLGTAFSFVHLLEAMEAQGREVRLPAGSRVMETGGYKGRSRRLPKPELHAWIRRRLGLPRHRIVCEYGMSELSSQAYDRRSGVDGAGVFRFPPWARARVISPEDGREVEAGGTGLLEVFDLGNVRSVAAIRTEDLAVRRGDGFELVGRAEAAEPRGCSLMPAEVAEAEMTA